MKEVVLDRSHDSQIVSFLDNLSRVNESILGYHYPFYRNLLEHIEVGKALYIGLVDNQDNLCAMLPGFIKTSQMGTTYSSLPFFGPNAGLLCDYNNLNIEAIHAQVFNFLFKQLEQYEIISASFYTPFNANNIFWIYDKILYNSLHVEKFTSYMPLSDFKLNSSLEYDIRKAKKSEIIINAEIKSNELDGIYDIYYKNCLDYGIPIKPKKCIEELIMIGKTSNNTKSFSAKVDNKIIGALIMIYSPTTASYYLPCSIHEYRSYQPTTFLIYHAINEAISRGIKYWNWESSPSKESGVFKFKKKWGSLESEYRIYIQPHKEPEFYQKIGQKTISELFKYFYVYPFNLI